MKKRKKAAEISEGKPRADIERMIHSAGGSIGDLETEASQMYSFKNDYAEGAHPRILQALLETNLEQTEGYGNDPYSAEAADLIKKRMECQDADIHFIPGGTQANLTAISAFLRPHQGAISVVSGHINTHEAGAIEATGHKVIPMQGAEGKLYPKDLQEALEMHTDEHMVQPKLVYISNSTELGSVYTREELTGLSEFCRQNGLILFVDGARLGAALTSYGNNLSLSDLSILTDAFYIGGTKNGALLGEALVICNKDLKEDFRFHIKQKGALLAKGRLMGIQFRELFRDNLFFELARHSNTMASKIQKALKEEGCSFLLESPSNQIFPILSNPVIEKLNRDYSFHVWERLDKERSAIRLVTSWATKEEEVDGFISAFRAAFHEK